MESFRSDSEISVSGNGLISGSFSLVHMATNAGGMQLAKDEAPRPLGCMAWEAFIPI